MTLARAETPASANPDAPDPRVDTTPLNHPLLSAEAKAIAAAHPEWSAEALLAELEVFDEIVEIEPGKSEVRSSVRLRDLERFDAAPVEEPKRVFSVDDAVARWLALVSLPPERVDVNVVFDASDDASVSAPHQQALAMLRGEAAVRADATAIRQQFVADRRAAGARAMADALAEAEALGGEVIAIAEAARVARLQLPLVALERLAERLEVTRIEQYVAHTDDAVGHSMFVEGPLDGIEIADLIQSEPFYTWGYHGSLNQWIGQIEKPPRTTHASFTTSGGWPRVWDCPTFSAGACVWSTNSSEGEHATKVASIMVSDLTLGQDAAITDADERRKRSGIARRAYVLRSKFNNPDLLDIFATYDITLVNRSESSEGDNDPCAGAFGDDVTTNSMYEAGIAWINSAGNNGHPDPDDCTVGRGAAAIGALAVNAIRVEDDPPMSPFLDNIETMADKSSQGGNGSLTGDAYGRSVVAFASYTGHNLRAEGQASANPQYSDVTQRFGITSASAPTAAGAAALFRQWYKAEQSDLIDDPGIMYAQLHLMTDGLVDLPTEAYDLIGFDGLYGGGRLRLRAFDPDGLDAPGGWAAGSVCVAHGTTANVDLNAGSALSAGVDYIKAVTWTYDHDHDDSPGAGHDRFSLTLGYHNGSAWVEAVTDASNDNKHRVFVDDAVGGKPWRLRISGVAVNSDNEGCGTDANRVYYAIVFEDNARDDDTTLSTFVRPEPGVGY